MAKEEKPIRYDEQGRKMCTAMSKRSQEDCKGPAMRGQNVCRFHGGSSPQARRRAKLRLAELVDPAVATLAREMTQAEKSSDRQRAANSILDRAGVGRVQKIEGTDAREILKQRLYEMHERAESPDFEDLVQEDF